ncbi:MAG TPA: polyhydroxyalkanoate synthesis regulator DNA-binding domain-containing protein [Myxococcota bacterium]|nr:polyhydroxyalkanoate synthesis regulator DNA-binding domain-containing protein [Myxococcota bacterium]
MLVKKYNNRRLYDTDASRYIRLDEIAARIRAGADVRVEDAKTGADLTAPTLAQIIFEDQNAARLLPPALLVQLIRMGEEPLADFLGRYVSWAFELYQQTRNGLGSFYNPFAAPRPFPSPAPAPPPVPPAEPPAPTAQDELKELRREMAELRRSLKPKSRRKR